MKKLSFLQIVLFGIIVLSLTLSSCRDVVAPPPPPVYRQSIFLSLEGAGVNEAYLRLNFTDTAGIKYFKIFLDGHFLCKGKMHAIDTVISDTTVLRAHTYSYRAYRLRDTTVIDSSKVVTLTTIDKASVSVIPVDVGVTDAYIQINMDDRNPLRGFILKRDSATILSGSVAGRDTVVYDTNLGIAHPYTYNLLRTYNGAAIDSALPVHMTTLDTTTHNFTWQIDTMGYLTSYLYDAAIINDNDFWVVGSIYDRDSSGGTTVDSYCAVEWTPAGWNYKKFYYPYIDPRGIKYNLLVGELRNIFALSPTDIWLGGWLHWDGTTITRYFMRDTFLTFTDNIGQIWGPSSNDLWDVGTGGSINHFDGTRWSKVLSGITSDITDVYGSPDGKTVWFCGWFDFEPTSLLRYRNGKVETIYNSFNYLYTYDTTRITGATMSVWTNGNRRVFPLTWYNLYEASSDTRGEGKTVRKTDPSAAWSFLRVRGNAINDIVVVGYNGLIWHYNGA
ncbi:MAG: hypothetical protein ACHQQQ_14920, partial [Bacteroidota bacterium]